MNTENIADKRTALLDLDCTVCGAPLHAATIYIGTDGRPAQNGEPLPVNQCVVCGENFPRPVSATGHDGTGSVRPAFVIDSDNRANWYMRKRFLAEQEIALLETQHADRMRSLRGDLDRLNAHFAPQLEAYTREKLATSKAKSHKFTFGTASFRTVASRWKITDPVTALATARLVCPEAVITPEPSLDETVLLAHVERTAEVIPGVGRSEERQSFSIKYNTEKSQTAQLDGKNFRQNAKQG